MRRNYVEFALDSFDRTGGRTGGWTVGFMGGQTGGLCLSKSLVHNGLGIKREVRAKTILASRGSKVQWRHNNSQPKSGNINNTSPQ